jgi:plastocyanin
MIAVRLGVAAFFVVLMTGCGSGSSNSMPTTPTPTPAAVTVSIPVNARTLGTASFVPNPVTVPVGTTVTWSNTDTIAHDVIADGGAWDSGRVAAAGVFSFTFQTKGSFPYHCSLHPGMVGTLVVQ